MKQSHKRRLTSSIPCSPGIWTRRLKIWAQASATPASITHAPSSDKCWSSPTHHPTHAGRTVNTYLKSHLTTLPDFPSSPPLQQQPYKCLQHDSFTSPLLALRCLCIPLLLVSFLRLSRKSLQVRPFSRQPCSVSHNGNITRKAIYSMSER